MRHLSIDIETKSSVDIGKAGLYRYAQSDDFDSFKCLIADFMLYKE